MNRAENQQLIKLIEQIAEMKVDMKYIKEHVGVINSELGQCVERIGKLEECNKMAKVVKEAGKEKLFNLQGRIREYASIIAMSVSVTTLILNLPKIIQLIRGC